MAPFKNTSNVVILAVAILVLTMTVVSASFMCPGDYVYPFGSLCDSPARYYGEEVYELAGQFVSGSLAPEWDESNSTYYVRLADVGATYKFEHWFTDERREAVEQSHDVSIVNVETGRALGWRQEGESEWFLVEVEVPGTAFQFTNWIGWPIVACPAIYPPLSCGVYTILNFGTRLGLSPYVEDNATYFKLSHLWKTFAFRLNKISNVTAA